MVQKKCSLSRCAEKRNQSKSIQINHLKENSVTYEDLDAFRKWIDVKEYLPRPFDLVLIKDSQNKELSAWFDGSRWDGYRITRKNEIKYWKRQSNDIYTKSREYTKSI